MQNRYAGDIGDYIKISLLRSISSGRKIGVNWYLYPDESHNSDGRHVAYLSDPAVWRDFDPVVFELLHRATSARRSVRGLHAILGDDVILFDEAVPSGHSPVERCSVRRSWFDRSLKVLQGCDLVFADPDNGLVDDQEWRRRTTVFGKQIPLLEARALSQGRCAVLYHHNSRFKGGHDAEVDHWLRALGMPALAVRATAFGCRTFFIINPDVEIAERTLEFCRRWQNHKVRLHRAPIM